jgi:phenylacetate-CoA ligase
MSIPESRYWNHWAETLNREAIDALHFKRLKLLLDYAYTRSAFYRDYWKRAGFHPDMVRSLEDFKNRVPLTDKKDFLQLQEDFPPYGPTVAVGEQDIAHHAETSGSTGLPLRIPFTDYDTERYGESWIYGWWALGIRPQDSFYFAFNWGNYAGFWSAYWGVRRFGAKLYSGGGQTTEQHVRNILRLKPTVLISTPSYALRILEAAGQMGVDLASSSLRFTYHAGEPGPCSLSSVRKKLDEGFGAISGELLGIAEVDAVAPGCRLRRGVHMSEMSNFSWSMDPVSGNEVGDGDIGENVLTTYANSAQPLINYRTHDLVRAFNRPVCGCGSTWRYLDGVVLGRSDYMITIKGTNVYPAAVENLISDVPGVSPHFQLVLSREGAFDNLLIRIEPEGHWDVSRWQGIADEVVQRIKDVVGVRLNAEIVEVGTLPRTELKAKRIVDTRELEFRRELDRSGGWAHS